MLALGAAPDRVWATGNTKLDALVLDGAARARGGAPRGDGPRPGRRCSWRDRRTRARGASSSACAQLLARLPRLQLVLAPRYVERAGRILASGRGGLSERFRSGGAAAGQARWSCSTPSASSPGAYRLATLVFVGGSSFVTRGGQNLLEPAADGKPVLGPHMENFKDSVQVLQARRAPGRTPDQLHKVADDSSRARTRSTSSARSRGARSR